MTAAFSTDGMSNDDALVADDPITRVRARACASGFMAGMTDWLNAEVRRPDFKPTDLLQALMDIQIQTHASIVASFFAAGGDTLWRKIYENAIEADYVEHIGRTRRHREAGQ